MHSFAHIDLSALFAAVYIHLLVGTIQTQGCESSSFQLISSFLKILVCKNFSFFVYFQPIFDILP